MKFELETIANDYAERVCNGNFPIEYTRQQVVNHTKDDFIVGANEHKKYVLSVLKENYEACKTLTDEDKIRSAQDIVKETYEDLIFILGGTVEILNVQPIEKPLCGWEKKIETNVCGFAKWWK